MAINQNHPFEELNGVKCAVVERNLVPERVAFLKDLLTLNHFDVVVIPSPPPKAAAKPAAVAEGGPILPESPAEPQAPETFTLGVTDVTFNAVNAVFGRLLRTKDGHVVTRDYWMQRSAVSLDDIPYYAG